METQDGPTPTDTEAAAPGKPRRLLLAIGAAVLVALVALVLVLVTGNDDGGKAEASDGAASSSGVPEEEAIPPAPPTPTPTGPTEVVDELPPALPEVPIGAPAAVGNGIVAAIASIEAIDGTGVGPGNIAGPALRVTVRIENGTPEAVSLAGVAVNLYSGTERTPASPLNDPSQAPFADSVDPGDAREGVYVFSVPTDVRDLLTVEVGYQAGAPLLLFTGPA